MRIRRWWGLALLSLGLLAAGPRSPSLDVVEPMPASSMVQAWFDALDAVGARVSDDFEREIAALHPLEVGRWSRTIMASVDGPGGTVQLTGTVLVEAVGPAESRFQVAPGGVIGAPEALAWRLVLWKASRRARATLAGQATTPAVVRERVVATLSDPLACVAEVAALERMQSPLGVELLVDSQNDIAATCTPTALAVVARASVDGDRWSDWFRRAWNGSTPVEQAALAQALLAAETLPPDLAALRQGLRLEREHAAEAARTSEQQQASAPLQCADGSIDPVCRCGDPPHTCCVHHGGVGACLPPPPE
ncbi:MAG: hypothetical protein CL927_15740 [Deltaproteobacteria bacterium]|nr:hypothetical protein [Deltaproteobacteria bacterium]HCH64154.1 hypothetical protein [Deltaproteobacteria bacterium]